eukprot:scaffold8.g1633.t1
MTETAPLEVEQQQIENGVKAAAAASNSGKPPLAAAASGAGSKRSVKPIAEEEEGKEKPAPVRTVSYLSLYRFADKTDIALLTLGAIGAIGSGAILPLMQARAEACLTAIFFGSLFTGLSAVPPDVSGINQLCLDFVYVGIGELVGGWLQYSMFKVTSLRQIRKYRHRFLRAALQQEVAFYDTQATAAHMLQCISDDCFQVQRGMGEKVGQVLSSLGSCFSGLILAFTYGWSMTLVMLSLIPVMFIVGIFAGLWFAKATHASDAGLAVSRSFAQQVVGNVRTVHSCSAEQRTIVKYNQLLEVPERDFRRAQIAGARLFDVLDRKPGMDKEAGAPPARDALARALRSRGRGTPVEEVRGELELKEVFFNYPSAPDIPVLRNMALHIPASTSAALVGGSGNGKSTVVGLLLRFYDPLAGQVLLDGVDIRTLQLRSMRQHVGLVSQEPVLFATTIATNISYGKEGTTMEEIVQAAKAANAHTFISHLPKGYDTLVGEKGVQMSGGQKQRIAIARAILGNPKVLVLDEATSALDSKSERIVQAALDNVAGGRTTVAIAHRLSTIVNSNRIFVVEKGEIKEQGTHSELLKLNGLYTALVSKQMIAKAEEEEAEVGEEEGDDVPAPLPSESKTAYASARSLSPQLSGRLSTHFSGASMPERLVPAPPEAVEELERTVLPERSVVSSYNAGLSSLAIVSCSRCGAQEGQEHEGVSQCNGSFPLEEQGRVGEEGRVDVLAWWIGWNGIPQQAGGRGHSRPGRTAVSNVVASFTTRPSDERRRSATRAASRCSREASGGGAAGCGVAWSQGSHIDGAPTAKSFGDVELEEVEKGAGADGGEEAATAPIPSVPLSRIMGVIKDRWYVLLIGLIGSAMMGAAMPGVGITISLMTTVLSTPCTINLSGVGWSAYNTSYWISLQSTQEFVSVTCQLPGCYSNSINPAACVPGPGADLPACPCNPSFETEVQKYALIFFGIAAGTFLGGLMQQWSFGFLGQKLARHMRAKMFGSLMRQARRGGRVGSGALTSGAIDNCMLTSPRPWEVGWFDRDENNSAAIMNRLSSDALAVKGQAADSMGLVTQNICTVGGGLAIAFAYNWKMALVVLACTPLLLVSGFTMAHIAAKAAKAEDDAFNTANVIASEGMSNIRVVAALTLEARLQRLYQEGVDPVIRQLTCTALIEGIGFGASFFIIFSSYALAFWFGGQLIEKGQATAADITTASPPILGIFMAALGMSQAQNQFPDVAKGKAAVGRVFALIDREPQARIDNMSDVGLAPETCEGRVELRRVKFAYPARPNALVFKSFSFVVSAGTSAALVGESGSGKSTIVGLLLRFYDPLEGKVCVDDLDIRDLSLTWLRAQIGLVGQEPVLFNGTIMENIRFGAPNASEEEVVAAAKAANAHDFVLGLDKGYDTEIGEQRSQLSGGQKQRIAIARAILRNPRILLLDEATSALDAESERVVQAALDSLMGGRTVVMIAHRLSTVRDADGIYVMERGHIIERGTHTELVAANSYYARLGPPVRSPSQELLPPRVRHVTLYGACASRNDLQKSSNRLATLTLRSTEQRLDMEVDLGAVLQAADEIKVKLSASGCLLLTPAAVPPAEVPPAEVPPAANGGISAPEQPGAVLAADTAGETAAPAGDGAQVARPFVLRQVAQHVLRQFDTSGAARLEMNANRLEFAVKGVSGPLCECSTMEMEAAMQPLTAQHGAEVVEGGDVSAVVLAEDAAPQLYVADLEVGGPGDRGALEPVEPLRSKALCLSRAGAKGVQERSVEGDLVVAEVSPQVLANLQALVADLYLPLLEESQDLASAAVQGAKQEFVQSATKLAAVLQEAASSLGSSAGLAPPEPALLAALDPRGGSRAFAKAAADAELAPRFTALLGQWCDAVEGLLSEGLAGVKGADEAGPELELQFWRRRMMVLNSITEQLQGVGARAVVGVCAATKVTVGARWRELELKLADAAAESRQTVKYLGTLEASLECLYTKPPAAIVDSLPLIVNNLRMLHGISRHYGQLNSLAAFVARIANQLIRRSREALVAGGRLWEQDKPSLIAGLKAADRLHAAFAEQCGTLLAGGAGGAEAATAALAKYGLFARRCRKLVAMLTTVHQFGALAAHTHIEGMGAIMARFQQLLEDIKKRPYDLLDYDRNQFDRDLLEFNVHINDLEVALQGVVAAAFEASPSTEASLLLLRQFEAVLGRNDVLRADLDMKYGVAFASFAADLEAVQKLYERHKAAPPLARNAPPVAGNIMWARHLLRRIEGPMKRFAMRKELMAAKDSKRPIRLYNRLAQALLEFEALWHAAWLRSVEAAKAQLSATLLGQHPQTGKYFVNFDKEVLQLMREAKYMRRLGLAVPDSAQMVLLQEEKFKHYHAQLSHALRELERVLGGISPTLRPLLRPHVEDLDAKVQPGLLVLTWTSMNIDGYLHRFHQCLVRTEELVRKANDIVANRLEANLAAVARTSLVDLPADRTFTYDEFISAQARHVRRQADGLVIRNQEVQRACEELLDMVASWPRENTETRMDAREAAAFRADCSRRMYQSLLSAMNLSFSALKRRLASKAVGGALFLERPVFGVDLQLRMPDVVLHPSLDEIQEAINTTAKRVLESTKALRMWGGLEGSAPASAGGDTPAVPASHYDLIVADPDIVKVVLLLAGSIDGMKQQAAEYMKSFQAFEFLWKTSVQAEYEAFMQRSPSLEEYEGQLKRLMAVETDIGLITPVHNIGALSLETQPLKHSLRAEAAAWKAQFANNLHKKGADDLKVESGRGEGQRMSGGEKAFDQYLHDATARLGRKIEDLEDVRAVMDTLREVREMEANIDRLVGPIEELYALLIRYEVRVPKEEIDLVGDLRYSWRKLRKLAADTADGLARVQVGFKRTLLQEVKAFVVDAVAFRADWEANGPTVLGLDPTEATDRLRKFQALFEVRKRKWTAYASGEELFGLPVTRYPELARTEEEITMLDKLYSLYVAVISVIRGFGDTLWADAVERVDAMGAQASEFQAACRRLPLALRDWPAYKDCRRAIDDFLEQLPLFQSLAHRAVRERHWKELMRITGRELNLAEDAFKLQHLLDVGLLEHRDEVEDLCAAAVKEEAIETKLRTVAEQWAAEEFTFGEHKQRGPVVLKPSDTAELMERLEDSLMVLGSMATNRYSTPFRPAVQDWIAKLSTVSEVIEQWLMVQNMWMYMEAVFSGGDIVKQLPQEAKRFQNIDKNHMKVVAHAAETRNVVNTCVASELLRSMLPHLLEQLELCQKSLSAYLETKRSEFPRFYFVSDPTLLEILSLGSDPPAVVHHFQSGLFDSVSNVDKTKMLEMFSREGEKVRFETPVEAKGNIEVWLQRLVDGMQGTMKAVIKRAAREVYEQGLEEFLFGHPAQVALLGLQFQWTADTQAALVAAKTDKGAVVRAAKKAEAILRELVSITLRTDLTRTQRTNLETCITVHMHQKEAVEDLARKKVRDPSDFEWLKQCRFYWREDRDTVIISICDVDFEYSYEYLGVKERLVITPLTDVCYITLSQALGMFLGGAPAGPAGTGKTETTKDLGNTLGKYVVVFNCSDQMDYKGMGKIYKGLAQSGLWGCFDEFNRINLDVLSVCAQQVYCVLSAIRERKKSFVFTDGSTVPLDPRVGFFITMNPGYAGRQELPENLKALFRGVTMMVPNRQIIIKVKLAACGYQENDLLSKKFFAHYDFGLRNILSVLRTAGASKRANPDRSEVFLLMRTLRDMNMSKFVAEDVPLFLSLIEDLFPGQKADRNAFPEVQAALEKVVAERGLQAHPSWMNKCIQLYETYLVRHGIMVVGPTGSGKSAIIDCLAAALTELGTKHVIWRMNPKAITAPQMFGRMDAATGDWTDGVFAVLWRRAAKAKNQNTWIVLDGPVDAIWIENLNTVLDDNKVLTLANGDRILMTSSMKARGQRCLAIFEPENLANASPATVSRAGIIYVSDSELGWQPVVASWLAQRPEREAAALRPCFDRLVGPLLDYVRVHLRPVMHNEQVCQVNTLLTLLSGVLKPAGGEGGSGSGSGAGGAAPAAPDRYERLFLYCAAWSLGGLLDGKDRPLFDAQMRGLSVQMPPKLSESDTVYEFLVDEASGQWVHWATRIPAWTYPRGVEKPKFTQLVIPTLDSVRYEHLLSLVHGVGKATLLVGGPGTAKTTMVQQFLGRFSKDDHLAKTITFSYLTTPGLFQQSMESVVEKRQGRTYGPPGGKAMTVFVDDISMPHINEWGDQVTNEIVRQLFETGGFYSLDKPIGDVKLLTDMRYVAAMAAPEGGKNDIPNRLKRHFAIINVPPPSTAAINDIFGTLMAGRFDPSTFGEAVADVAARLVPATMALWQRVQAKMLPTPAKFHYLFNMRDLSKVFQGVILAQRNRFMLPAVAASGKAGSAAGAVTLPAFGGRVTSPEGYLLALWAHECQRVFADKLISLEDKAWVEGVVQELCQQTFGPEQAAQAAEPLYFVDFLREPPRDEATGELCGPRPSAYEAVPGGQAEVRGRIEELMAKFNAESRTLKMDLVLFKDALDHVVRISRLLSMERGSALLVGVGGSGKQSLAHLAAYIAGAATFQITITKTYGVANLLEDIKGLYRIAGLKGQPVCFIFSDAEVKDEAFLEYINQLLMTGEIAGLFPKDELDALLNDLRPTFKAECPGAPDTWDDLYSFFINRVRDRLHSVLCFSPVGKKFARWAQQFPGLINGCTIDWFLPWPEEALTAVSSKLLGSFALECTPEVKAALQRMMASVHMQVTEACVEYHDRFRRQAHVTPKSYLSFIAGFKDLYARKLASLRELSASIGSGLQKMNEAKGDVNRMKAELAVKNQELAEAAHEAEKLLKEISASTAVAEKEKAKVAVIVEAVSCKAEEIATVKEDAERDLAEAKPALDAALAALNSITPKDITALKALKNPPDVIKRIFDCVLLLRWVQLWHKPVNKVTWQDVKGSQVLAGTYDEAVKMMGDITFLSQAREGTLINFPKEGINDETVELLQPYFAAPDFNYDSAKKASGNVAGLCNWAESMCKYHMVAKVVEPKIAALHEAEAELRVAVRERAAVEEELAVVQGKLDEMQAKFDAAMAQKQALEEDAAATQRKMDAANALISALGDEEVRWTAQSRAFDDTIARLAGNCAIASSFVSYLGPFNKEFRELLLTRDFYATCVSLGIPVTKDLQVASFLVDETEVGEWNVQGLPTDDLSVQNGILVTRATRPPVLIDPQGQGRVWLLNKEAPHGLRVTQLGDRQFRSHLEECLSFGRPLLIENVEEELDPVLDPVLERRYVKKGRTLLVQLGDKEVDVSEGFRLFCTTRLPNPRFTPELSAKTTVIDFTVTQAGLEDQLLGKLILKEKHELEEQRLRLVAEVQSYKARIKQLEDDLLFRLSNSQGNLLDDTELIDILAVTKQTAQEVNERLLTASETRRSIVAACEEYRPVARRATLLYFLIAEFSVVNCMYQAGCWWWGWGGGVGGGGREMRTSLTQFNELYEASIDSSEHAVLPAKRIHAIIEHMTWEIFLYITRGLFERHKLTFALMLAAKVLVSAGAIKPEEVDVFLKMGAALDIASVRRKPKDWIPDAVWLSVCALSTLDAFRDLPESVARSDAAWRAWYDAEAPEAAPVPDFDTRLSRFERMSVVRAFRADRTLVAATQLISATLGQRFVESVPLSMEQAWSESRPATPLIFLLSLGADPTRLVDELVRRKKVKVLAVSMGQGQEVIARKYMATAAAEGHWVMLQNTHLGLGYLAEVEAFLTRGEGLHENFRVFITAEPHPAFPIGLLQMSIKITNEAPVGIKAGLRASYQWVSQDMLDSVTRYEYRQLLFVTCFLHSVVQERRKFGPIGWNVPYEFNAGDLSACVQFLQNHILEMVLLRGFEVFRDDRTGARITVPDGVEIEAFREAIEALPPAESPELFGLNSNADLTFRSLQVSEAVDTILATMPAAAAGRGGLSREEVVDQLCADLLSKLPPVFEGEATREKLRKLGATQPLTIHLRQEIDRLNRVLTATATVFGNLRLAIAGTIALSDELVEALEALGLGRVPRRLAKISWESPGLGAWFAGLLQRHDQLYKWLNQGRPRSFLLPAFFNPQGFLTAVRQEVARKHAAEKWALDDVVVVSEVTKQLDGDAMRDSPAEGVYCHGLYLEGAAWSVKEQRLVDAAPKQLVCPLPVVHITAVLARDKRKAGFYSAPMYRSKKRTGLNYVSDLMLRCTEEPAFWVLRGAAVLFSAD